MEPGGFLYKDASVAVETVTHKLSAAGQRIRGRSRAPRASLRGLAGLKAAARARRASGPPVGHVLQTASGCSPARVLTLMRLPGPGRYRHPVDVHGPRVRRDVRRHHHLPLSLLPDVLERRRPELPELRRPRRRGPPHDHVGLDGVAAIPGHDPPADGPSSAQIMG